MKRKHAKPQYLPWQKKNQSEIQGKEEREKKVKEKRGKVTHSKIEKAF